MNIHTVFGSWGFVGSNLCKLPDFVHNEPDTSIEFRDKFSADYPDIVYSIGTVHNYHPTENKPYIDIQTNLMHMISVLQSARIQYGNDFTFNYISTWFVYGKSVELPASEESCCSPKGFYSVTKLAAEQLIESYCNTFGIKFRIIRLCNVLGIGDTKVSSKRNALQHMVKTLAQGGEINLYDEDCQRDYLHIDDVVSGIATIVEKGNYGEVYNVGSGVPTSIHSLVRQAHRDSGYVGKINLVPVPEFHKTVQVRDMWLNNTKLLNLGWQPSRNVNEVVEDLTNYYKEIKEVTSE